MLWLYRNSRSRRGLKMDRICRGQHAQGQAEEGQTRKAGQSAAAGKGRLLRRASIEKASQDAEECQQRCSTAERVYLSQHGVASPSPAARALVVEAVGAVVASGAAAAAPRATPPLCAERRRGGDGKGGKFLSNLVPFSILGFQCATDFRLCFQLRLKLKVRRRAQAERTKVLQH